MHQRQMAKLEVENEVIVESTTEKKNLTKEVKVGTKKAVTKKVETKKESSKEKK